MIEVVSVIEGLSKAISLAEEAKKFFAKFEPKKKRLFNKYIEPAFEALQPVVKFYADNIARFRGDISKAKDRRAVGEAIERFREERRNIVHQRSKIIPALDLTLSFMEKELAKKRISESSFLLREFMDNLRRYFVCSSFMFNKTRDGFAIKKDDFREPQSSLALSLLESAEEYLSEFEELSDKRTRTAAAKSLVAVCDAAIEALEDRSKLLYKSFTALKLECYEG
jgi:hypothetical protein